MKLSKEELPDKILKAYKRWSEITGINSLDGFFSDFYCFFMERSHIDNDNNDNHLHYTYKGINNECDIVIMEYNRDVSNFNIALWDKESKKNFGFIDRYCDYILAL